MPEYITDNIEVSDNGSDKENSNQENSDKKILMKKIKYRMHLVLIFLMPQMKKIYSV